MPDEIEYLDDATRPAPPVLEGLSQADRGAGEHLKMIHDQLRQNMEVLGRLIERAAAGEARAEDVVDETGRLAMVANYRRFGNLCGQYCMFVNTHHSIEDQALFPQLAKKSPVMRAIAERLQAEHVVVHALLERLVAALNALIEAPTAQNFAAAREVYDTLARVLLSHLGYEEDAIGDALGFYRIL